MKRLIRLAAAGALLAALPALAADGPNIDAAAKGKADTRIRAAALSAELADTGRAMREPLLLIAAAKLRKGVEARPVERKAETEDGGMAASDGGAIPDDWQAMLDDAVKLAPGNETIAELADDIRAETSKGKTDGPAYNIAVLPAGKRNIYRDVTFTGSEYAEVYVEGSDRVNIDLFVKDGNGNTVCSDTDPSHIGYCAWTPRWTDKFTIIVENRGNADDRYSLMTN